MSIRAEHLDDGFLKHVRHGAVAPPLPRGVSYKQKCVPFIGKGEEGVARSFNCTPPPSIWWVSIWQVCVLLKVTCRLCLLM